MPAFCCSLEPPSTAYATLDAHNNPLDANAAAAAGEHSADRQTDRRPLAEARYRRRRCAGIASPLAAVPAAALQPVFLFGASPDAAALIL